MPLILFVMLLLKSSIHNETGTSALPLLSPTSYSHPFSLYTFSLCYSLLDLYIQIEKSSATGAYQVVLRSDLSSTTLDFNFCFFPFYRVFSSSYFSNICSTICSSILISCIHHGFSLIYPATRSIFQFSLFAYLLFAVLDPLVLCT